MDTTPVEVVRRELIEEVGSAVRREANAVAEEGTNLASRAGFEPRPLTVEADRAADAILRVARNESAAAVVVGSGSRNGLGSLLLGSVSRSVIDKCPVPVVVVSDDHHRTTAHGRA